MGYASSKVYVISDEKLGGVKREYVEVEREGRPGDYVVVTSENMLGENHTGKVYKVTEIEYGLLNTDGKWGDGSVLNLDVGQYKTLEPTDIVVIDGNRYRLVDRKAEVGNIVLITEEDEEHNGLVGEVVRSYGDSISVNVDDILDYYPFLFSDEYRVIEPVEKEKDVLELIANLARRVSRMESDINTLFDNVRTWAEEVERVKAVLARAADKDA